MKKMFIATMAALAMTSIVFAQETPASTQQAAEPIQEVAPAQQQVAEPVQEVAPVQQAASQPAQEAAPEQPIIAQNEAQPAAPTAATEHLGISLDLNNMTEWNLVFKATENLNILGVFGFTDLFKMDNSDFDFVVGAGVSYTLTRRLLPLSLEGVIKFTALEETENSTHYDYNTELTYTKEESDYQYTLGADLMLTVTVPVVSHFQLIGKAGINYSVGLKDGAPHLDPTFIHSVTKVSAVWYFL